MSFVRTSDGLIHIEHRNLNAVLAEYADRIIMLLINNDRLWKKLFAANLPLLETIFCSGKYAARVLSHYPLLRSLGINTRDGKYVDEVLKHKNIDRLQVNGPLDRRLLDSSVSHLRFEYGEIDPREFQVLTTINTLVLGTVTHKHDPKRSKLLLVDEDLARFALEFL